MARKQVKKYTPEFKWNAVRVVQESDRPIAEVARELGVQYQTLYEWVRVAEGSARPGHNGAQMRGTARQRPAPVAQKGPEAESGEVRRLRKELEQVRLERDFLKKAAAFFAKQQG
jgi:transposase